MPVLFFISKERANYGRYVGDPSADELTLYFYLCQKRSDEVSCGHYATQTTRMLKRILRSIAP